MIGVGASNVATGIVGAFVVDGSLSKTAAADQAGQKTQFASIALTAAVFFTILFLTGLFETADSGPKVFSSFSQLDFKPSDLTEETLQSVWRRFDEIVDMDVPVRIYYTDRDGLDVGDDARKRSFLEKIPPGVETLRMVEIGEYALTFCMGTHVKSTGEIGKLKDLRLEPKKKRRKIVYFEL